MAWFGEIARKIFRQPQPEVKKPEPPSFPLFSKDGKTSVDLQDYKDGFSVRINRAGQLKTHGPYKEEKPTPEAFRVSNDGNIITFMVQPGILLVDRDGFLTKYSSLRKGNFKEHINDYKLSDKGNTLIVQYLEYSNGASSDRYHIIVDRGKNVNDLVGWLLYIAKDGSVVMSASSDKKHGDIWIDQNGDKKHFMSVNEENTENEVLRLGINIEYASENGEVILAGIKINIGRFEGGQRVSVGEAKEKGLYYKGKIIKNFLLHFHDGYQIFIKEGNNLIIYKNGKETNLDSFGNISLPIALSDSGNSIAVLRIENLIEELLVINLETNNFTKFHIPKGEKMETLLYESWDYESGVGSGVISPVGMSRDGNTICWLTTAVADKDQEKTTNKILHVFTNGKYLELTETNQLEFNQYPNFKVADKGEVVKMDISEVGKRKELIIMDDGKVVKKENALVNPFKHVYQQGH